MFLPFVGSGERLEVIGLSLSREGLWAAWNILAKATLGAAASVILAVHHPGPRPAQGLQPACASLGSSPR